MGPFFAPDKIASLGKRGYPAAIDEHRVPTHMVNMEMSTQHEVDRIARKSTLFQIGEKGGLQHAPAREIARLIVADASIDDDSLAARFDYQGMNAHPDAAVFVREMW